MVKFNMWYLFLGLMTFYCTVKLLFIQISTHL